MLNAERFKKQILDVVEDDKKYNFAIKDDDPNAFSNCHSDISCKNCIFTSLKNGKNCLYNRFNWLLSEHKEPVKLTKFEYDFLNAFQDKESSYLARDKDGSIFLYLNKPSKEEEIWADYESSLAILDRLFKFVKWQDSEPTSIKEILENCEVIEDESDG